jgi:hypothetical protein
MKTGESDYHFDFKSFTFGKNEISDSQWEQIKNSDIGKQLIEWKALEEVEQKEEVTPPPTNELSTLSVEGAEKVIEQTSDLKLLQRWAEQDRRKSVINAANLRIKAIKEGRV